MSIKLCKTFLLCKQQALINNMLNYLDIYICMTFLESRQIQFINKQEVKRFFIVIIFNQRLHQKTFALTENKLKSFSALISKTNVYAKKKHQQESFAQKTDNISQALQIN